MKKLLVVLLSSLLLLATGCSDAYANVSNANEAIFTVGNQTIDKGQVYTFLKSSDLSSKVLDDAISKIVAVEVPLTDEMKNEAQSQLDEMISMYGGEEMFLYYMQMYGYNYGSIEEYGNALNQATQINELVKKYVDENFDTVVATYNPRKGYVMSFASADDAAAALIELNNGTDAAEVATAYNSTSTGAEEIITSQSGYTAEVMSVINGATAAMNEYTQIAGSDGNFYVIKVTDVDPNNFKDEAIDSLTSVGTISTDCYASYLKKYNFTIYDKDIYDSFKAAYPDYLSE